MMCARGTSPLAFSLREMISITEAWFLGFYSPWDWAEILEKLEALADNGPTSIFDDEGNARPLSNKAMDDLQALFLEAQGAPEAPSADSA